MRLCYEVGVGLLQRLRSGRGIGLGERVSLGRRLRLRSRVGLCVDVNLCLRFRSRQGVALGDSIVNDLRRYPYTCCRDELGGRHNLGRCDSIGVRHGFGNDLGHGDCCRVGDRLTYHMVNDRHGRREKHNLRPSWSWSLC